MLTVVSPAKTLDFETRSPIAKSKTTIPAFVPESAALVKKMKTLTPKRLQDLMGVSKNLADLNHQRYQDWDEASIAPQGKAAVFAFQGDVYQGLRAENFTAKQLEYAQAHFRILSGLYGILRPLDLILPYRLEMGIPLKTRRGSNLYDYWGDLLVENVNEALTATKSNFLLNLASNEYFRSLPPSKLEMPVISPAFKEMKNGKYKMISFFAKKARGTMASWVIKNKVRTLKKLQQFGDDGYRYDADTSTERVPVFLRG